jgi:hypothetical protein
MVGLITKLGSGKPFIKSTAEERRAPCQMRGALSKTAAL